MAEKDPTEPSPPPVPKVDEPAKHEATTDVELTMDTPAAVEYPSSFRFSLILLSICVASFLVGLVSDPRLRSYFNSSQDASRASLQLTSLLVGPNHRRDCRAENHRAIPCLRRHCVVDIGLSVRTR